MKVDVLTNQISMFEMINTENMFTPERQKLRRALRMGSGFQGGKERIKQKAKELTKTEFVKFLPKEYGVGGSSFEGGFVDYTSMHFYISEKGWETRKEYSWTEVANEILDMIDTNSY